jgi:hypothetical protein
VSGRIIVKYSQLFTGRSHAGIRILHPETLVFPVYLIHDSEVTAWLTPGMNYAVLLLLQRPEELSLRPGFLSVRSRVGG